MARAAKTAPVDTTERTVLTVDRIARLACPPGVSKVFLRDAELPGFKVRCTASGAKAFVYECKLNGKSRSFTIGSVDAWQIADARAEGRRLAVMVDQGQDPAELERQRVAAAEAEQAARRRQTTYTLGTLLTAYCDHMKRLGRVSHVKARGIFDKHIMQAHPDLAKTPAANVTAEAIADVMRALAEAGKLRTANKLRAYLRSAYGLAMRARTDAAVPVAFKAFGITSNPVALTVPVEGGNAADKNPLSLDEMRSYWQTVKQDPTHRGAVLRLHLLTGAQRITQLLRLQADAVQADRITLHDGKGRPGQPARAHVVPLTPAAALALAQANSGGACVLSADGGKTCLSPRTFATWAAEAGKAAGIAEFEAKRLRSGVETLLAGAGVSREARGHLQSHGIGGVQARHYDANDYLNVKRNALEVLFAQLEETTGSVVHVSFGT